MNWLPQRESQGNQTLAAIVLVVAAMLTILGVLQGYPAIWKVLNVPQMSQSFGDLRNLTGAAESIQAGFDPLISNPGDPWSRPLNHPRIVQFVVSGLDLDLDDTPVLRRNDARRDVGVSRGFLFQAVLVVKTS